jgi:hypothetical protein
MTKNFDLLTSPELTADVEVLDVTEVDVVEAPASGIDYAALRRRTAERLAAKKAAEQKRRDDLWNAMLAEKRRLGWRS